MYKSIQTDYEDDEVFLKDETYGEKICRYTCENCYSLRMCLKSDCTKLDLKKCAPENTPDCSCCSICISPFALLGDILMFPIRTVSYCMSCY